MLYFQKCYTTHVCFSTKKHMDFCSPDRCLGLSASVRSAKPWSCQASPPARSLHRPGSFRTAAAPPRPCSSSCAARARHGRRRPLPSLELKLLAGSASGPPPCRVGPTRRGGGRPCRRRRRPWSSSPEMRSTSSLELLRCRTRTAGAAGWWWLFSKKMFVWLFYLFFKKNICRVYFGHSAKSLPSVRQKTLGKVCLPIKIYQVSFAECHTRQTLCRVFFRLCRVPDLLIPVVKVGCVAVREPSFCLYS